MNLRGDLAAGLTVAVMLVPQAMAYAMRDKTRIVPLNNICREILQKYKRLVDSELLQISARYPGSEGASWLCRRISRKTKMPKFGAHAIRHRFATEMIRKGVSIYKVSKILGHSSVKITEQIYIHLVPQDLLGITDILDNSL